MINKTGAVEGISARLTSDPHGMREVTAFGECIVQKEGKYCIQSAQLMQPILRRSDRPGTDGLMGVLVKDASPMSVASAEDIVLQLTEAVHEHRVLPGTKLSEDEVGEIFGVSRTVVRQALRTMAHAGLVSLQRNRGAFVAKPSVTEAREVFEARALLEPQTARAAAERATPADIALLETHIVEEHTALAAGEAGRALKLSGLFHLEIARIADQQTIEDFIRQLVSRSSLVIALYWQRRNALCESHAHHALVDALRRNDPNTAEELMKGHLVDLLSQLNLRETPHAPQSLRKAILG